MCLAAWADYDDETIRAIWLVERLRQQRDTRMKEQAERLHMAAQVRRTLDTLDMMGETE